MRVLGVDLASARWRDIGTALVEFDGGAWSRVQVGVVPWPGEGRPSAEGVASAIAEYCAKHDVAAVSIDGPQAWRDPRRPAAEGVGRACERATATPGKTGPAGVTYPANYLAWTMLSIEVFRLLRDRGAVLAPGGEPGSLLLLECFPTSTWRALGLTPLPAKGKRPDVRSWAGELERATGLPVPEGVGHDELQAVVAALPAAALLGGPAEAIGRGVPATDLDGVLVEGLIWEAVPAARRPVLVLVTGPPGAGKTTIARELADALELPLVEKDALKEILGGALGITDRPASHRLGAGVFEVMRHVVHDLLRRGASVIAEGNFTAQSSLVSGLPPCRVVQMHVTAEPAVLRERLRARDRHGVHYDTEASDEIAARAAAGEWDALPLDGDLVRVDTTDAFPDVRSIVSRSVFG